MRGGCALYINKMPSCLQALAHQLGLLHVFLTSEAPADGAGTKRHLRELDLNAPLGPGADPGVTTGPALERATFLISVFPCHP